MAEISRAWIVRARGLGLKPKTDAYLSEQRSFLQGVLAALTQTGVMTQDDAHMIGVVVYAGRIDEVMQMASAAELDKAARVPS